MRSSMTFGFRARLRGQRSVELLDEPLRFGLPMVNKRISLGSLLVNRLVVGCCRLAYMNLNASLCMVEEILN